jgi:hypothetical protein
MQKGQLMTRIQGQDEWHTMFEPENTADDVRAILHLLVALGLIILVLGALVVAAIYELISSIWFRGWRRYQCHSNFAHLRRRKFPRLISVSISRPTDRERAFSAGARGGAVAPPGTAAWWRPSIGGSARVGALAQPVAQALDLDDGGVMQQAAQETAFELLEIDLVGIQSPIKTKPDKYPRISRSPLRKMKSSG